MRYRNMNTMLKNRKHKQNLVIIVVIGIIFCQVFSIANQSNLLSPESEKPTNQRSLPQLLRTRNADLSSTTSSIRDTRIGESNTQAILKGTTVTLVQLGNDENVQSGTSAVLSNLIKDVKVSINKPTTLAELKTILPVGHSIIIGHGLPGGFVLDDEVHEWSTLYAIINQWFTAEQIFLLMCHSQEGFERVMSQIPVKIKPTRGIVDSELSGAHVAYQITRSILQSFAVVFSTREYRFLESLNAHLQAVGQRLLELVFSKLGGIRDFLTLEKPPIYFKWSLKFGWFSVKLKVEVRAQKIRLASYLAAATIMMGLGFVGGVHWQHLAVMLIDILAETFFEIPGGWIGKAIKDLILYTIIPVLLDVFAPQLGTIGDAEALSRQRATQSFMDKYIRHNGGRTMTQFAQALALGTLTAKIWATTFYAMAVAAVAAYRYIVVPLIAKVLSVSSYYVWKAMNYALLSGAWKLILELPSIALAMLYRARNHITALFVGAFAVWLGRLIMHSATEYSHARNEGYSNMLSFEIGV